MLVAWTIFHLLLGLGLIAGMILASRNLATGLLWFFGTATWHYVLFRIGHWVVIGWWWPGVLWVLLLTAAALSAIRWLGGRFSLFPTRFRGWIGFIVAAALLASGSYLGARLWRADAPAAVPTIDISSPFVAGEFIVASGGFDPLVNAHLETLDTAVKRYRDWRGQSYAIDFFGIGPHGFRASGLQPEDPSRYAIFDAEIVAPCAGRVIATENDLPDLAVPGRDREKKLGNHVLLRCEDAVIVFAHLKRGSVSVSPGEEVDMGAPLGRVGNSGNAGEPHLHIHAQREARSDRPISGEPLALRVNGRYLVRGDRLAGQP